MRKFVSGLSSFLVAVLCFTPFASPQAQAAAATSVCKDGTTTAASGRGLCLRRCLPRLPGLLVLRVLHRA